MSDNVEKELDREYYKGFLTASARSAMLGYENYITSGEAEKRLPSGFPSLDKALDGGFYSGLYVLAAVTSLGKTSFCLQIADQIAASGNDVIIFSLEMSEYELMSRSIVREIRKKYGPESGGANARYLKTIREVTSKTAREDIYLHGASSPNASIIQGETEYNKYNSHIYIYQGIGNYDIEQIRKVVDAHVKFYTHTETDPVTGEERKIIPYPFVLVDYLQIIAKPEGSFTSDKQVADRNIVELKRLSRDYKIPVLAVSSLNRNNYNTEINSAALKESGGIEYTADCIIGLQYADTAEKLSSAGDAIKKEKAMKELQAANDEKAKNGEPVKVEAKILKQRNFYKSSVYFNYDKKYYFFEDIGTEY